MKAVNLLHNRARGSMQESKPPDLGKTPVDIAPSNDQLSLALGSNQESMVVDSVTANEPYWYLTLVYGSPHLSLRYELWSGMKDLAGQISGEWFVGDDFNCVLSVADTGGTSGLSRDSQCFSGCLLDCGLQDIGFHGQPFTWQHGVIRRRLDSMAFA
ncbi:hypothetical protein Ahy_B09g097931 isoform B [Arachis hypogaea]|uniref:Uncharacterized protein n=1 Tax=Arachis hypogaea TaxID=3818 RepID=A0A444XQ75_ARAHY|nr:hypothetical protein Ahy_B09g097931 isoform A [Arachis hypogaea]RYQ91887.1 hypothetical protein Ahy_B09g097931 isoform B [Arachis hypogaea]